MSQISADIMAKTVFPILTVLQLLLAEGHGLECLSCSSVTDPGMCVQSTTCSDDKMCFIHHFVGARDVYTLGCDEHNLVCKGQSPIIVIGKREIPSSSAQNVACCTTDLCNEGKMMGIMALYQRKNSTVQIITSSPNNTVNIYETAGAVHTQTTLVNPGDHLDLVIPGQGTVSASQGVLVAMYVHACCPSFHTVHEPFMMVVPGVDRYLSEYSFAVWDDGHGFQNHITVVIPKNSALGLELNKNALTPPPVVYNVNLKGVTYSVFDVSVQPGAHRIVHKQGQKFGLFVHGNRWANGYGYNAGMSYN